MTLIHRLFEGQAAREPDRIALVFAPEPGAPRIELTYGELDRRAGRLAAHLRGLGVGPEQRVGVSLDRSPDMIVALLAILKAGGAYAPLDPAYPKERLSLMMEDAFAGLASPVLVTREELLPRLPPVPDEVAVVCVGKDFAEEQDIEDGWALAGNLAYLIFTSGSTGRPKAVAIEHRSAVEMIRWAQGVYTPEELAGVFASTSINFDLSVFEMFVPLASGGRIILGENALALARTPAANEVTLINTVPSAIAELLHMGAVPPSARTVNLAGEPLRGSLARRIHETGTVERLWNLYGPSEDTTYSTFAEVPPGDGEPTIGRPLPGTRAHVLDASLDRAPGEDAGELYLAGPGLARGYLNRPDLTAERFVPDPFAEEGGQRMYRTGDLVRWLPGGDLKYIGRVDHQVKIRGFRIEIGEIEAALASYPGVRDAAVLAREDEPGEKRLVAYVVASVQSGEILDFLRRKLPDPMLPSAFVFLDEMPLNPNGKVDRGALMRIVPSAHRGPLETPRTPVETVLADLWAEALGLEQVGITDDFLESGGHSLLASRILTRVREIFGVDLPPGALFEAPTVAALALRVESRQGAEAPPPILPAPADRPLPLSFAQERLWILDRLTPGLAVYNIPLALHLRGPVDPVALEGAFNGIVLRHETLRTSFPEVAGRPYQAIAPFAPRALPVVDLRGVPDPEAEVHVRLEEDALRHFDLARGPLWRSVLYRLGEDRFTLSLNFHHGISDGWSMEVLARELSALYTGSPLPSLPVRYADFAVWQRRWLSGDELDRQIAWWREELAGAPTLLDLPLDRPRGAAPSFRGARHTLAIPSEVAQQVAGIARQTGATLFMVLISAFQALLYRLGGQRDVLVGAPIANRNRRELEDLIGFFANTLVFRGRFGPEVAFRGLVQRVRTAALGAYAHQDLPFEKLVEELRIERSLSHNPLFQVAFAFQSPLMEELELPGVSHRVEDLQGLSSKFDLFLSLWEVPDGFAGTLDYATDLFDDPTVERLVRRFQTLLAAAAADPDRPLSEIDLLDGAERSQVVLEWNDTWTDYPRESCIHELFEEQVRRRPDAVALRHEIGSITYAELDARAEALAGRLRAEGVGPDTLVGLCLERSPEAVVALVGILKAGGAFAPLDPAYPADRLAYILADTAAPVLVTRRELLARLPASGARVLFVGEEEGDRVETGRRPVPDNLAYVMYTSGSTGRPKGVAVTHRNVVRLVKENWFADLGEDQVFLQLAPLAFDASTLEIWGALLNGGTLVVHPPQPPTLEELGAALVREGITTLWLTAGLFHQMAEARVASFRGVRQLLAGGDVLSAPHVARVLREVPPGKITLINGYGPTESTTFACCHPVRDPAEVGASVPIGRPISNTSVYLVDPGMRPVPLGVPGELCIGGDGLARGYLNRPDLTAERFVPDPLGPDSLGQPGGRLYRTGDLARFRAGGEIEFLGRIDQQVKIRGFRIEPGEIEAVLAEHPGLAEAAVAVRGDGSDRSLAAYVVEKIPGAAGGLRAWLEERLPVYMVPSAFAVLDGLPLNPNGKVDRRALARIEPGAATDRQIAGPRTPTEELLAGIFAELLGLERVGIDEDFFALGGHSLLATRLVSRLASEMEVELSLRTVFGAPTVAGLAGRVEEALLAGHLGTGEPIVPRPRREGEPLLLSFAQERLWLVDRLTPGLSVYNIPLALRLTGAVDPEALAAALDEVARRHETLRATFREMGGQPRQVILPFRLLDRHLVDFRGHEPEAWHWLAEEAARPFDLTSEPLLRTALLRLDEEEWVLFVNIHHIVSDGWSLDVLSRELTALYGAFSQGLPSPLPELPVQYADFVLWQREHLSEPVLKRLTAWWKDQLLGMPEVLELPTDRPRPAVQTFRGSLRLPRWSPALAGAVRLLSRRSGTTLFMTLTAAFQSLLHRLSGQMDLAIGSPIASRNHREVEELIGFFVNTLVLRARFEAGAGEGISFRELLEQVKAVSLGAYTHQELPFERLVEELRITRSLRHSPLVQVMFALQSTQPEALGLPGVAVERVELGTRATAFDLGLSVWERGAGLAGELEYSTDLFDAATVDRMMEQLRVLLEGAVADPDSPVAGLPLLSGAELQQLREWNDTRLDGTEISVPRTFEARARRTPDAPAVVFEGESLTFSELDRRAGLLARRLRRSGVERGARVVLLVERSLDVVVGILGIWKAGGAYVPLSPDLPRARLSFQITDAALGQSAPLLVAQERLRGLLDGLPLAGIETVLLEDIADDGDLGGAGELPEIRPDDPAYLIYTSGTTGHPKAVLVEHGNLAQTLRAAQAAFEFEPADRMPCLAAFTFDIFLFELLGPLLAGGTSVLYPLKPGLDVARLVEDLPGCTRLHGVPALMHEVAELVRAQGLGTGLKQVFVGGDAVAANLLDEMREVFPRARTTILYGPTEATIISSSHEVSGGETGDRILLGRPLANVVLDLRDGYGELVPVGVPGEIWIGGPGVARGYLHQPELTREKFVILEGERRYRTGDLARRLPDGTLEFLGRIDHQVKVRGFRIELGEIEAVLAQHPDVRRAVVLALRDGGEARLVAYVVGADAEGIEGAALRPYLASRLPDYMVPSALVFLDELPVTPHGKVDRKALARIVPAVEEHRSEAAAPRTPTEEILASAWGELLGLARVGVHDNFFELGGHSLLATRLLFRISSDLGVSLPLRAVFEAPTVAALAERVDRDASAGRGQAPPIQRVSRESGDLPLSFAQERLWFLDRLEPDSAFYNMPFALHLTGELDIGALEIAIGEIVRRHEILRTTFRQDGGLPRQVISDALPGLPIVDLEGLPAGLREPEAEQRLIAAGLLPFDLEKGPLLRAFLLRLSGQEHTLLLSLHHIAGDGWSFEVLRGELAALYRGQAGPALPELPVQYADYAVWQREWLRGEVLEREIAWWKEELDGAPTVLSLPVDRLRPAVQSFRGTIVQRELEPGLLESVREVSRRQGTTRFMTCLAVFQLLLHRLSAQDDILVGTPVAGRSRREVQGLIGLFINTVVVRGRFGGPGVTFADLLARARTSTLDVYAHQDLPFEKLVEELGGERSLSHNPLFQVLFSLQDDPVLPGLPGLGTAWQALPLHSTKVDLALSVDDQGAGMEYATDLFDRTTIERMLGHFRILLEGATSEPDRPVAALPLLSEAERHQLVEWNDPRPQPAGLPVHLLFEEQARRVPDAVAVVFQDESLTYGELSRRSDAVAARLRGLGVGKGTRVGLKVDRSTGMVAALLGIWKAGGAYVPLDPHQPEARLELLIEDAILGQDAQVVIDQDFLNGEQGAEDVPGEPVSLRDLAYLIYTSGTTGRPKAVMVEHGNLAQTLRAAQEAFDFEPTDRMPSLAAFTFDIFLLELLGPLLAGGTVVLFPLKPTLDVPRLVDGLDELTLLHAVPAVMREVVEGARIKGTGTLLRQLFVGGDAVPSDLLSDMRAAFPSAHIHVLYGPTEAAIICSSHEVGPTESRSLLGRPLSGAILELRDRHGHLVPIGVPGEVWIGGEGVARGYLHQPDLTAEKFVTLEGRRWYRSGDLARRLADGTLEFLGRIDHQVKVRGFRIELGEIESVLAQHPSVSQAAVLAVGEAHGKRLAAFVSIEGEVDAETLRSFLAARLPDYMVPSSFTVLDTLPLTSHGKVDRRALERRAPASAREPEEWVPPATPTEVALAAIWSEVLGVERVGLRDGFFELGGHSLMATRLVSRVGTALAVELPLRTVFEAPVLEAMAARIDALRAAGAGLQVPPIVPVSRERDLPLSFAQERLWFLYQLEPESPLYNILAALRLAGSLDVGALRASLNEIVRRHEVLRTTYAHEGRGVQRIASPTEILLSVADLRGLPEEARDPESLRLVKQEELRPFDLRQGPVARFRLLRLDETRWILLLAIHHIASDGWSTGVLMQELMELYEGCALPELPVQYGDFAVWQRGLEGEILERLLAWWRQALAGAPTRIDLPLDRPRPAAQRYRGATRPLNVSLELFQKADDLSRKLGTTLFMTLFACFQVLLHRVTGQDDLLVGTPVAGRNRGETESLIGCFVNTLVLRARLEPGERDEITFRNLLGRVRAMALDAFMHQDLPFEKLVEDLQVERSLSYNPLFQVLFTLQNAPMEDPRLPGVAISPVEGDSDVSLFDLSLGLGEFRGEVLGGLQYNVDLFDAATVDRWAEHFRLLLEGVVENPDRRLGDLPGLAEPERRQQADEAPASEEALQARVAARGDEVAERRSALSDQKRAALEKLLRARRKQS